MPYGLWGLVKGAISMKTFSEDVNRMGGQCIILLDAAEGRDLVDMCEAACKANKRKKRWKKLWKKLTETLCCF